MAHLEAGALWALAANELPAEERARLESHLAGCAACVAELERVKAHRALLQEARAATPQVRWDDVGSRLRSAAAAHLERRAPRARWPWAVALAGACAALLVLWLARGQSRPVDERSASEAIARTHPASGSTDDGAGTVRAESTAGAMVKKGAGGEQPLRTGMRLRSGVAVRTPARASAVLRLPDASRVRLSADSEVELSRAETKDVHLTVHQGRLSVRASHAERRAFLVEVAGLRVSVVGTVFTVERTAHGASVAVSEGRVRVEVAGHPARLVGAGERMELHEGAEGNVLEQEALSAPDREAVVALDAPVVVDDSSAQVTEDEAAADVHLAEASSPGSAGSMASPNDVPVDGRDSVASPPAGTVGLGTSPTVGLAEGTGTHEKTASAPPSVGAGTRGKATVAAPSVATTGRREKRAVTSPSLGADTREAPPGAPPSVGDGTHGQHAVAKSPGDASGGRSTQPEPSAPATAESTQATPPTVLAHGPKAETTTAKPPEPLVAPSTSGHAPALSSVPPSTAPVVTEAMPRPESTPPSSPPRSIFALNTGTSRTPQRMSPADPSQEFEPYPAPSVTERLSQSARTPPLPETVAEGPPPKKKRAPLIPVELLSKDADERFLGYVRLQLGPRTCEGFLSGLEEIAAKSPRADHREQARYLKARCFEERLQATDAKMEYRQYLNDFPRGRYAREASTALLP
ncbi:FecR domain-containing protein [Myxococcus stipitatus]|uniref:FecR domain-containing protein n=1 Tax=Myxococcus stipitatus TaxID=83455 RepID=UPI001F1DFD72|nr:FecR domain-containing protein [Myxococcus stipitatus]MCE9666252.1 FecR domain-containing protein [Myxococcus stipitatus]